MSESNLSTLLKNLRPVQVPGRFVFVGLPEGQAGEAKAFATVREDEGLSAVVAQSEADRLGLAYDYVAGWITLRVESSLAAVGMTAAVSRRLTEVGISCNVIAGLRHDHLLVPVARVEEAIRLLAHR